MNEQRVESREKPRREGRVYARGKKGTQWIAWYDCEGREHRESIGSRDPRVADRKLRARLSAKPPVWAVRRCGPCGSGVVHDQRLTWKTS